MTGSTGGAEVGAIEIRGLRVLCHVGVPEVERAAPQPVELDVDLAVDLTRAGDTDDVGDTVDYGAAAVAVRDAVTATPVALLERLAHLAADAALSLDHRVLRVTVTVRKLRPPVPVDVATTAVRVHRSRT